jgi:membrane associated rhomboid family serine protease
MDSMPEDGTVVYRSAHRAGCADRALVLTAVGISARIEFEAGLYALLVADADAPAAHEQLQRYDSENRVAAAPRMPPAPRYFAKAWVGCVAYVLVLVAVGLGVSHGIGRLDAFDTGELDAEKIQAGQWWRAWTALTLHLDVAHIVANLGAGVWFGYLAARQIGSGSAWFLIVNGAAAANLLEALLGPASHRAVGASTAVFTALGLLAAHSWNRRRQLPQRWALRWAPLVAGALLLGWLGAGGAAGDDAPPGSGESGADSVDVVAHVLGFLVGAALGALAALAPVERAINRVPQWLSGLSALAVLAVAWAYALRS